MNEPIYILFLIIVLVVSALLVYPLWRHKRHILSVVILVSFTSMSLFLYQQMGASDKLEDIEMQQKGRKVLRQLLKMDNPEF